MEVGQYKAGAMLTFQCALYRVINYRRDTKNVSSLQLLIAILV